MNDLRKIKTDSHRGAQGFSFGGGFGLAWNGLSGLQLQLSSSITGEPGEPRELTQDIFASECGMGKEADLSRKR